MASYILFVTFLFSGAVFGNPVFQHEESNDIDTSLKIINGSFTTINSYPYDVSFLISNNIWGTGVLLDHSWILTLAFNCYWVDPSYITVRAQSSYWTREGIVVPAEKCFIHPDYSGTWANNIALVKLNGKIPFTDTSRVGYFNYELKTPNKSYDVSGWGTRSSSYAKEEQLQTIPQTIISDEECNKYYNLTVATGSFCASNPVGGPCVFDLGAPMNYKRKIVGLYQGSLDCTQPKTYPDLYVDVFQYSDWINMTMTHN